ncbi:MAG: chorismate mutase [Actinomycetia bacterium]|nr:chorismate mutase [Actinomycetes bacterium]
MIARTGGEPAADLTRLRQGIDDVDARLIALLGERFGLTREVGRLKAAHGLASRDPSREASQHARWSTLAAEADVDPALVRDVFDLVLARSVAEHEAAKTASGDDAARP